MDNQNVQKLLRAGFWFVVILSAFFVVLSLAALKAMGQIGTGSPANNTITVSGEGEVFAVPDIAEFSFSVTEEREDVAAAQEAAAEKINSITEFLEDSDIDEEDIRTTGYNLYPRYEYRTVSEPEIEIYPPDRERVLVGYEVTQSITVKVRDIDSSGSVLGGIGSLGATNVSGLTFTIDDEDALISEARELAIEDAQEKAEELADALGVDLVRVVSFSESGIPTYPRYSFDYFDEAAALEFGGAVPDIPVGENQITSNVSVTYEIR